MLEKCSPNDFSLLSSEDLSTLLVGDRGFGILGATAFLESCLYADVEF